MRSEKIIAVMIGSALLVAGLISFAADQPMIISATVPDASGVIVTLTQINAQTDEWGSEANDVLFGNLTYNATLGIFTSDYYYAADCAVNGGSGWTIQHDVSGADILGTGNNNLGDNIVVSFVRQINSTSDVPIDKVAIRNADRTISAASILPGWLRIYYAIATTTNATVGVTPITGNETADTYSGTVEITLTP